jgi:hypothetical protein
MFYIFTTKLYTMRSILILSAALLIFFFNGCNKNDRSLNLFSINDDIELGKQLEQEIASNPSEYPLLSETAYPQAYAYIKGLRDSILNGGNVYYKDKFEWKVKIIQDDNTLNAFCAPGGYIYIYTGLIKYLDSEDELIGVLGHEMAHADRRHSTDQLTKNFGLSLLIGIVTGTTGQTPHWHSAEKMKLKQMSIQLNIYALHLIMQQVQQVFLKKLKPRVVKMFRSFSAHILTLITEFRIYIKSRLIINVREQQFMISVTLILKTVYPKIICP